MVFKINRRDALRFPAAAAVLGAPAIARGQEAQRISIALAARGPRTIDPMKSTQGADNWAIDNMYETLVRSPDGNFAMTPGDFEPGLAERWESTPDAKTWSFQLRRGVKFHKNYGELSSEDVKFTFERVRAEGADKVLFENIADVRTDGPLTVVFTLRRPDPLFCGASLFVIGGMIVSKRAVTEKGEDFGRSGVGTGPYEMASFDPNRGIFLKTFDGYWGEKPRVPNLDVLYLLDTTARTLALLSNRVDMIEGVRAPGWIQSIQQRKPDVKFDGTVPGSINTLHINLTRPPFNDLRVRQALMHALNRRQIADALAPMGGVLWGLNPPIFPGGMTEEKLPPELRYPHDPAKARQLLTEAGHPNGFAFPAFTSQREDYSSQVLIIQEQLRRVGMNMQLRVIDHTTYHNDNRRDLNTVALHSSSYPPIPTQLLLEQLSRSAEVKSDGNGGINYSHYGTALPGIDTLLEQTLDEPNFQRRIALCEQIELQVLRDLPLIGVSSLSYVIARNPRVDVGYPVRSGYARWRLTRATIVG
jgi:peptide/nickel transport system substrate-binding protein